MLFTEFFEHEGRALRKVYSDTYLIECRGEMYSEAVDPADTDRIYVETDIPLDGEEEE